MTEDEKKYLDGIAKTIDAMAGGNFAILTERDIIDYLLVRGVECHFTRKLDKDVIEVGFPFKTHEENAERGFTCCYVSGFETSYNSPARLLALSAIKNFAENIIKNNGNGGGI